MGYPQVSFGGLFSAIGDPTSFVSRENRSYEMYDNVMFDRGGHHLKFGGYLFQLRVQPGESRPTRGATSRSTASGPATRSPIFCSGTRASSQVGIGRADEHGRSTWLHVYGQDDWRIRPNLTLNYGLRYEINGQMTDVDNRLSAVDLPGTALRHRQRRRRDALARRRGAAVRRSRSATRRRTMPDGRDGLLRPSYRRFAPRLGMVWSPGDSGKTVVNAGFGVFLNQWAYSVQQALAPTLPFFFAKTVTAAADAVQPTHDIVDRAAGAGQRHGRRQHDGLGFPDRVREELFGFGSAPADAGDHGRGELPALGDRRRRQLHGPQRARAGPGRDRSAAAGSAAGQHHRHPLGRLLDLQRRHVPRRAAAVARAGVHGVLHAVESHRRCVGSWRDGVRGQPAAGCAEHGGRGSAGQLRSPASFRRQRHLRGAGHSAAAGSRRRSPRAGS